MLMQMKKSVCFDNAKVGRKVFIGKNINELLIFFGEMVTKLHPMRLFNVILLILTKT